LNEEPENRTALLMRTWNDGEAELVRHLLDSYGIPCQVVSDVPHSLFPLSVDGLGEVRLVVPAARLEEAKAILAEHRRQGMEGIAGERASEGDEDEGEGGS
jgi:hypothetical protein